MRFRPENLLEYLMTRQPQATTGSITSAARLFGHCFLFLATLLRADYATCQTEMARILTIPLTGGIHPFSLGRRMTVQVLHGHFVQPALAGALPTLLAPADLIPRHLEPITGFAAGYHYFVSEALFLTDRYADQLRFLADAYQRHPERRTQADNLFSQLMLAHECTTLLAALLPQYRWFKDYCEALYSLTELPFAADGTKEAALQTAIRALVQ